MEITKRSSWLVARGLLDLADVVANAVATLNEAGKLAQQTLTLHVEPVFVEADPIRIEQVVVNLLSNAIKYTPAGGSIEVRIGVEKNDAVLRVSDTGIGIPQDLLPRLFGLFVQGDRTAHARTSGLGIGLALVRWLVELHGGQVSAWSEGSGQGSTFEVRLPKARPLFKVVPTASRPASRELAPAGHQSAARIAVGTHL